MRRRFVIGKVLGAISTLVFVVVFNFFLFRVVNGYPINSMFRGRNLTPEQLERLRVKFNLDGTNIYMTLAALFIAQATGVELTLQQEITLLLVAILSSKGAAGVTGAGFITLAATLAVVPSVPVAGMALILGIDRFMSECRAVTNFIGNAVATIVVATWEGALDAGALAVALNDSKSKNC